MRGVRHICLAGLGAAAFAAAAGAQEAVYFDGTFGNPGPAPSVPFGATGVDYRIDAARGQVNGDTQLFHSFSRFGIPADDAATFTGPDSIDFIFARVTGDAVSEIDGLLRSEVGDADLYVLNPYGVVFGPTASLDVGGSFHVSTADVLRFDAGQEFEARAGGAIPTIVAVPAEFGFLNDGNSPAAIKFDRTGNFGVDPGNTLSAVAGRVEIIGRGPFVDTPTLLSEGGGAIQLAAVPAGTDVPLEVADLAAADLSSDEPAIRLTANAIVLLDRGVTQGPGRIVIRGGRFEMVREQGDVKSGEVDAFASAGVPDGPTAIDIEVAGAISVDGGEIKSVTQSPAAGGASGDIRLVAGGISLRNGTEVFGELGDFLHAEDGPSIRVQTTGTLEIASGAILATRDDLLAGSTSGELGDIWVEAESIVVDGAGSEISTASAGTGNGGVVHLDADSAIAVANGGAIRASRQMSFLPSGEPTDPGRIEIFADQLSVTGGSEIVASTSTNFDGPDLYLGIEPGSEPRPVPAVTVTAGSIGSVTSGSGQGGDVTVHAGQILLASDPDIPDSTGRISAVTQGAGPGGNLSVYADSIDMIDGGQMSTSTKPGAGPAGDLTVAVTGRLFASGTTTVGATPVSSGLFSRGADADGGNLTITADSIDLERGADTSTSALGDGKPGDMLLTARAISVTGAADSPTSIAAKSDAGEGEGGDLTIDTDTLAVTAGGEITTSTTGKRNAGDVLVTAREILVEGTDEFGFNRSGITSRALQNATGRAGSVTLQPHDGERLTLLIRDRGRASVESKGFGAAGELLITGADLIEVSGGGEISATVGDVFTDDPGGPAAVASDIRIRDTDTLRVAGGQITAATSGSGFGGSLDIAATNVELSDATLTAKTSGSGDGGSIEVGATSVALIDSTITAETSDTGQGGFIDLAAETVDLSRAEITARSTGDAPDSGNAGAISLRADQSFRMARSEISTQAEEAAAGDITLSGGQTAEIAKRSLVSSLTNGTGDAGDISVVDTQTVFISGHSVITAETNGAGTGGTITFQNVGDVLLSDDSSITTKSTAAAGGGAAGDIVIAARRSFQAENSSITTTAENAGGGRISIQGGQLVYLLDSLVETTVKGADDVAGADAGDIDIPLRGDEGAEPLPLAAAAAAAETGDGLDPVVPEFVVINRSIVRANAVATDAGNISIAGGDVLISTDSVIEATSEKGVSGEIQISSPDADVVSQVTPLPSSFVDPSDRLLPPCTARTERTGSFVVQSREAISPAPDAPLSPSLVGEPGAAGAPPATHPGGCPTVKENS